MGVVSIKILDTLKIYKRGRNRGTTEIMPTFSYPLTTKMSYNLRIFF
jgi:hypothetical protein